MTMTAQERKPRTRGRRPQFRLEPSPYSLTDPLGVPPERLRHDPRIPDQRLTAFWVTVKGEHVGRVQMVEFEDRPGWYYQPEVCDPASEGPCMPEPFGNPEAKRRDAVDAVIDEWRDRRQRQLRGGKRKGPRA